jgi:hypothetical protein
MEEEEVELEAVEEVRRVEEIEWEAAEGSQKGLEDVFGKEREAVVLRKVAMQAEVKAALENKEKWIWPVKNYPFRGFLRPKRSLEQYMTRIEDAFVLGHIVRSVGSGLTRRWWAGEWRTWGPGPGSWDWWR